MTDELNLELEAQRSRYALVEAYRGQIKNGTINPEDIVRTHEYATQAGFHTGFTIGRRVGFLGGLVVMTVSVVILIMAYSLWVR